MDDTGVDAGAEVGASCEHGGVQAGDACASKSGGGLSPGSLSFVGADVIGAGQAGSVWSCSTSSTGGRWVKS